MTLASQPRMALCHPALASLALLSALLLPVAPAAADEATDNDLLEAAVLYRVLTFLQWPQESGAAASEGPLIVAVVGNVRFAERLGEISRVPRARGRRLEARVVEKVEAATGADVVVIARLAEVEAAQALQRERAVLVVGRSRESADRGASLAIFPASGRISLRVNQRSLLESRISASYQLLALAEVVGVQ